MKPWILVPVLLAWTALYMAAGEGGARGEDGSLYQEGKKAFRTCAPCHCATEPRLREDTVWTELLETTSCIDAGELTPRIRKAIACFFEGEETLRPLLVDESYVPEEDLPWGTLRVPPTSGSAYLKADRDSIRDGTPPKVRLYWKASEKGKTLRVPAGRYRVVNYRFYRTKGAEGGGGELWTLSATNMNGCVEITVEEGRTLDLPLAPVLSGALSAVRTREGLRVALALHDGKKNTATLAQGGRIRVPSFTVSDASGRELYRAPFENT